MILSLRSFLFLCLLWWEKFYSAQCKDKLIADNNFPRPTFLYYFHVLLYPFTTRHFHMILFLSATISGCANFTASSNFRQFRFLPKKISANLDSLKAKSHKAYSRRFNFPPDNSRQENLRESEWAVTWLGGKLRHALFFTIFSRLCSPSPLLIFKN